MTANFDHADTISLNFNKTRWNWSRKIFYLLCWHALNN